MCVARMAPAIEDQDDTFEHVFSLVCYKCSCAAFDMSLFGSSFMSVFHLKISRSLSFTACALIGAC